MKKTFLIGLGLMMIGCKSPFDRTRDASNGGATGTFSGTTALVIFNNELVTGGSAFEFPGGQNVTLSFTDTSNPISHRSIRFFWNGGPAAIGGTDHTFAGFDLIDVVDNTPTLTIYASTPGRDLHQAGYTKATFYARGSLSTNTDLKIEVAGATPQDCLVLSTSGQDTLGACATGQLTAGWQVFKITLSPGSLNAVKDFFKATFVYTDPIQGVPGQPPGNGGTAYFDKIQYEP